MRLVQFTRFDNWNNRQVGAVWINAEQVLWVEPSECFTSICFGNVTREEVGEIVHVAEPIDEVVRALSTDPALVQEHARLKQLAETTAQSYTTWEQTAERRGAAGLSDAERGQWSVVWAHAMTAASDLEAFRAAHPEFNEAAP